ncbi:MAG: glycosyltransferase family 2 protein [Ketobacteraceae bacterium]|nr:glycosyltransferase family 2 protein [Ketobacteraceae bacterium]
MTNLVSIVIPAKNEAAALEKLLPNIRQVMPDSEIIVINDGSTDNTIAVCEQCDVICVTHPYSKGNGSAIKTGARTARGDILVFMDGDGQHDPNDIPKMLDLLARGYDMVVGARDRASQASLGRLAANTLYNNLSSWMVGHEVKDLTSGFRAVRAGYFKQFLSLLPNGFSYPTTITMAFFRAGYSVAYLPIVAAQRIGKSHISLSRDGVRFLLIIFKVGTLFSPLKLFTPISLAFFFTGLTYYMYTFWTAGRFTNMSALLLSISVLVFLMGLISEQVTNLMYSQRGGPRASDLRPDDDS